jgi:Cu-Zn family superoxide dismutase
MRASLLLALASLAAAVLAASGCHYFSGAPGSAYADLEPTRGHSAKGHVDFLQSGDRVRVHAVVTGLRPGSEHGFHIHEVGDCSAPDASSAKGHFNPYGKAHAHYTAAEHHAGDLPALRADAEGRAEFVVELRIISLTGGPANVTGRSVVVHANPDDFRTQPAGNSGARIACGVIRPRED